MTAQFGQRLRKGATTTAVAAVAVAALSASQAPGINHSALGDAGPGQEATDANASPDFSATGNSPYHTDLPPLTTPDKPGTSIDLPATGSAEAGIPATVLDAYKKAEGAVKATDPACQVPWQLLAAIGKVESGQARGGKVDANGTTPSPILGPVLNGVGFANISDTDDGAYDGDSRYDRAVGPMQFIPSTWATWGQDGNDDGRKDPNNIYDAALAAGRYLCAGDRDLTVATDLDRAILSYNQSREYLRTVLSWFEYYKKGTHEVPDGTGTLPASDTPDSSGSGSGSDTNTGSGSDSGSGSGATKPKPPANETPEQKPKPPTKPTKPPTKPTDPPTKPTDPPTKPPATSLVSRIENAGPAELTAMAGRAFTDRIAVRLENSLGRGVAEQEVRFEILGGTEARFSGGKRTAILTTGKDGKVLAPVLVAGELIAGKDEETFTVRATVVGRKLPPVDVTATVTPRAADTLSRIDETPLTAVAGTEFAQTIDLKAAHQGAVASGVEVTATLVKSKEDPTENDKGPCFQDADGKPVRTLAGLTTDAEGRLTLPKLFAENQAGTFVLRLTAVGGASLTIDLTVTAPPAPVASAS